MASYRQLPEVFRRLHPKFKTPWPLPHRLRGLRSRSSSCCRARRTSSGRCTRSARCSRSPSLTRPWTMLRYAPTGAGVPRAAEPARRRRRLAAVRGPRRPRHRGDRGSSSWCSNPPTRWAGLGWLAAGFALYVVYRRRFVNAPLTETLRAPIVLGRATALEYRTISCRSSGQRESEAALDLACAPGEPSAARRDRRADRASRSRSSCRSTRRSTKGWTGGRRPARRGPGDRRGLRRRRDRRFLRARRAGRAIVGEAARGDRELIVIGSPRRAARGPRAGFRGDGRPRAEERSVPRPRRGRGRRAAERREPRALTAIFGAVGDRHRESRSRPDRPPRRRASARPRDPLRGSPSAGVYLLRRRSRQPPPSG